MPQWEKKEMGIQVLCSWSEVQMGSTQVFNYMALPDAAGHPGSPVSRLGGFRGPKGEKGDQAGPKQGPENRFFFGGGFGSPTKIDKAGKKVGTI